MRPISMARKPRSVPQDPRVEPGREKVGSRKRNGEVRKASAKTGAPKRLRFLHADIKVVGCAMEENLGEWDIRTATIKYDSAAAVQVQKETVLHEMMHAILEHTAVDAEMHEDIIRAISPLLLHMLTMNPKMVGWLTSPA